MLADAVLQYLIDEELGVKPADRAAPGPEQAGPEIVDVQGETRCAWVPDEVIAEATRGLLGIENAWRNATISFADHRAERDKLMRALRAQKTQPGHESPTGMQSADPDVRGRATELSEAFNGVWSRSSTLVAAGRLIESDSYPINAGETDAEHRDRVAKVLFAHLKNGFPDATPDR